jgi:multidrug efflux pump subunit AcrB
MKSRQDFSSLRISFVYLLLLLIFTVGAGAVSRMDMKVFPEQTLPTYTIRAAAPGLMAELVAERVTKPVEEAIRELGSVEKITSRTQSGSALITVKAKENIGSHYQERLTEKMAEVAKQLPGGPNSLQVQKTEAGDTEIGFYLLHGADLQTLADVARYTVYEKLVNLPGISRIEIEDQGIENKVEIVLRPSMLQAYGLTPGEVIGQLQGVSSVEQIGEVGKGESGTSFTWINQSTSVQELGRTLIATNKGYVALKLLADIRDLRGSLGESITVYKGEPAIGIRVFAQETGQAPQASKAVTRAIQELNRDSKSGYEIEEFEIRSVMLTGAIRDSVYMVGIAALVSAICIGFWVRSVRAALLSLLSAAAALSTLVGGIWVSGLSLNIASLGPVVVFAFLFVGAGTILFLGYARAESFGRESVDSVTKKLLPALLLAMVILVALFVSLLYTDYLKPSDKPSLYEGLPIFGWGIVSMLLVYGFVTPTLAAHWLKQSSAAPVPSRKAEGKLTGRIVKKWERLVNQRYVPYGITLTISLVTVVILHTFVLVDPYLKVDANRMTLSLAMVKGSAVENAVQSARHAEEKLRRFGEIRDLYTVATERELTFHISLRDKYDWTLSRTNLEKEMEKQLRDIPGTDPFSLVVGESKGTRLEFTVKGPSLQTTREMANQMLRFLIGLGWREDNGREIITDERIGAGDGRTYIDIRPKPEMMARYRISEAQVKNQLESYLGEQSAGSVFWNNTAVPLVVRYPEKLMQHADQVKNVLIRTPEGAVKLGDLVDWRIGAAPTVLEREDGLYVFKVSSAVSEPNRIDGLYYFLPNRMKETVSFPEGYLIQTGEEIRKLEKEQSEKKDVSSRLFTGSLAVLSVLLASLLIKRRVYDGITALLLLPALLGAVLLGLLLFNRPLNVMGFYGSAAAAALLLQQSLTFLTYLQQERERRESVEDAVRFAAGQYLRTMGTLFATVCLAVLPLTLGWGTNVDFHASFAVALLAGFLLTGWAVMVLLPGMYQAAELRKLKVAGAEAAFSERLQAWWENYQVRRKDMREWKQKEREEEQNRNNENRMSRRDADHLSPDDFLPISHE